MGTIDALEFLSQAPHPELGIPQPIDLDAKPPIVLPHMTRAHLAKLFAQVGFKRVAEIGVCRGVYSEKLLDANPNLELWAIDPWEVYDGYEEEQYRKHPDLMRECYQEALGRLAHRNTHILRMYSMAAVDLFTDGELDAVHIDGNHRFLEVAQDIHYWGRKVRRGGIISGHDYARFRHRPTCHVKSVVNAWTYSHRIRPWFVLSGKGNSSWFWVKG